MDAAKRSTKPVRLDLSAKHHHLLRQLAAKVNIPMSRYVRQLIEKEVERRSKQQLQHLGSGE